MPSAARPAALQRQLRMQSYACSQHQISSDAARGCILNHLLPGMMRIFGPPSATQRTPLTSGHANTAPHDRPGAPYAGSTATRRMRAAACLRRWWRAPSASAPSRTTWRATAAAASACPRAAETSITPSSSTTRQGAGCTAAAVTVRDLCRRLFRLHRGGCRQQAYKLAVCRAVFRISAKRRST